MANSLEATSRFIQIDKSDLGRCSRADMEEKIRRIVRSVKFGLSETAGGIRLLGPDMSYHDADPHLSEVLGKFWNGMRIEDIQSYKTRRQKFDLCFEDSWSGYFIADRLAKNTDGDDLVLVHLDDHTDMMPTLLVHSEDALTDPATGLKFDPTVKDNWQTAIHSGSVSIGNFVTPLYFSSRNVHVRHLNNYTTSTYRLYNVTCAFNRYWLIPDTQFASIHKRTSAWQDTTGTYLGGQCADAVLDNLPSGQIIVHIDLDYFINDFNGNIGTECTVPNAALMEAAQRKMDRFFDALAASISCVDRWIVATSPGFCSAWHWQDLLNGIEERIEAFEARQY